MAQRAVHRWHQNAGASPSRPQSARQQNRLVVYATDSPQKAKADRCVFVSKSYLSSRDCSGLADKSLCFRCRAVPVRAANSSLDEAERDGAASSSEPTSGPDLKVMLLC